MPGCVKYWIYASEKFSSTVLKLYLFLLFYADIDCCKITKIKRALGSIATEGRTQNEFR